VCNVLVEVKDVENSGVLQGSLLTPFQGRIRRILLVARVADELEGKGGEGGDENQGHQEQHNFLLSGVFPLNACEVLRVTHYTAASMPSATI
jgi:hypothetical protein